MIPWNLIGLFFSGALQRLLTGLSVAGKWLLADWRNLAVTALALFGAFHHFILQPRMSALLEQSQQLVEAAQLAHLGTISNFIDASAEAQRQAEANAARVKADQEKITDATLADLRSDHAALRLRFDRLRARGAAVDPGRADPAGLPGTRDAAGRAAGAPADQDLRAARDLTPQPLCPSQFVCLTIDQAEQASRDAHNHDRLIDWVIAQSAVRFSPEEPAE
ncbi:MAG: hypothetical protein NBV68_03255 [Erythrobacter sp.]|uniref:hypothetical protein n=1 Tax=Erythrobacter sp. TaxID=1042 RepID=UPI0025D5788C|nr:hypothetical protein [Erythrobacter sp.]MCL9998375.1 hypothetical protein [Erythrobacter sp.]